MERASLNVAWQWPQHCFDPRFDSHTPIAGVTAARVVATISTSERMLLTGRHMAIPVKIKVASIILPRPAYVKSGFSQLLASLRRLALLY